MEQEYMARIGKGKKTKNLIGKKTIQSNGSLRMRAECQKTMEVDGGGNEEKREKIQGQKQMSELFGLEFERESLVLGIKKWRGEVSA